MGKSWRFILDDKNREIFYNRNSNAHVLLGKSEPLASLQQALKLPYESEMVAAYVALSSHRVSVYTAPTMKVWFDSEDNAQEGQLDFLIN